MHLYDLYYLHQLSKIELVNLYLLKYKYHPIYPLILLLIYKVLSPSSRYNKLYFSIVGKHKFVVFIIYAIFYWDSDVVSELKITNYDVEKSTFYKMCNITSTSECWSPINNKCLNFTHFRLLFFAISHPHVDHSLE